METKKYKESASPKSNLIHHVNTAISLLHLWEDQDKLLCKIPQSLHHDIRQANDSIEDKSDIFSHSFFMEADKLTLEILNKHFYKRRIKMLDSLWLLIPANLIAWFIVYQLEK